MNDSTNLDKIISLVVLVISDLA